MNCLYCGQKLSGNRNPELGSFCSADHQRKFGVDIRVLLQLQNPGRLEIPRPESPASSNCLYCSQPLSIRKRLKGWQFCNSDHEDLYYRSWNEQAMARLGGAAALEDDLYGVDLTEGDPQAIPRCQYCNEPLSVGRRLKRRRFCSEEHEEQYRQQQSSLVFSRLRAEDRPRARPRRLWDARNTEGCAGFEPMTVPPRPGRLTLYPVEGIQFSVSPAILRFGGEILKLASGGAVARPRLRGLTLGRTEVMAVGRVDLKIAVPPPPAVICRLGEPAAEPSANLIVLPGSAGCAAIRDDLPREAFVTPELLLPPRDAGFLDYARTQIPERFRRPLWMPRMAVPSLRPAMAEEPEPQKEAAGQQNEMVPPASAGPLAGGHRWAASVLPAPVFRSAWIGAKGNLLLPSPEGPPLQGGRLAGSEYSKPRVLARVAGQRAPGWIDGNAGGVNMPKVLRGVGAHASRAPMSGDAYRFHSLASPAAQCAASAAKDLPRTAQRRETFPGPGSQEALFPRLGAVLSEASMGAAGFHAVGRTREFFILPRGVADAFLTDAAPGSEPKIAAWRDKHWLDKNLMRGGGYRHPPPQAPAPVKQACAAEWKIPPAPILVRRSLPGRTATVVGSPGLTRLARAARSGRRHGPQGQMWRAPEATSRPVYPSWPQVPFEGKPARREHLAVTPPVRGGLAISMDHVPRNEQDEPRGKIWQTGTVSPHPVCPAVVQVPFASKPAPPEHLTVIRSARRAGTQWAGNRRWEAWTGTPGPALPAGMDGGPATAVLGNGRPWPLGSSPTPLARAMRGEPRFAGTGSVEMPEPSKNGGVALLRRTGERVEWAAQAGVRARANGEWRDPSLAKPRLPGPGEEARLTCGRPGVAASIGWRAGMDETEGLSRELVIAYRFVFPAAAATELELLPAGRRAGSRGKIVVLR
ncbi:MAG: hypothetical protein LC126_21705 [Bryobacterales bacterium]|nr:hypothetical protein [Bryobacterales bacterium]